MGWKALREMEKSSDEQGRECEELREMVPRVADSLACSSAPPATPAAKLPERGFNLSQVLIHLFFSLNILEFCEP